MFKLPPPRIKVCGVRDLASVDLIANSAADCVGINLVPTSRRSVDVAMAVQLAQRAAELDLRSAAILMNPTSELIEEVLQNCQFDFLQLHGQESPELLSDQLGINIIKAVSWSGRTAEQELVESWLSASQSSSWNLSAFLLDAYAPNEGGGTGRTADWTLLNPRPLCFQTTPLILAGGLNPANVSEAIRVTQANGVDTASGVESSVGIKDKTLTMEFAARAAKSLQLV